MKQFYSCLFAMLVAFTVLVLCAEYRYERGQLERARDQLRDDIERARSSPDALERAIGYRTAAVHPALGSGDWEHSR